MLIAVIAVVEAGLGIVVEGGRVVGRGTHDELLDAGGRVPRHPHRGPGRPRRAAARVVRLRGHPGPGQRRGGAVAATGSPSVAHAGMALFGAGYMGLSAVLILWARHAWPSDAGAGTSILFIALATGQALGSAGFGAARDLLSPVVLATLAASRCAAGAVAPLLCRR